MLNGFRNFVYRHRKKFIIAGVFVGGVFIANHFLQQKIRDWQEAVAKDFVEKTRRKYHFENTERTCDHTTLSLAIKLRDTILKLLDTETLISSVKNGRVNKVKTWEEIKVFVFTRLALIIYAEVMLSIVVRIQVNIIGALTYQGANSNAAAANDLQEKYLSFCLHFLGTGVNELKSCIESKVKLIVDKVSLKEKLVLENIQRQFWMIQSSISNDQEDPLKNISKYVFSADALNEQNPILKTWLTDTIDLLNSNEVQSLATSCVNRGFSVIMDEISIAFLERSKDTFGTKQLSSGNHVDVNIQNGSFINVNGTSMPMAKVIPILNGLFKLDDSIGNGNHLNSWINSIISYDKIKTLGANVYEGFSQPS